MNECSFRRCMVVFSLAFLIIVGVLSWGLVVTAGEITDTRIKYLEAELEFAKNRHEIIKADFCERIISPSVCGDQEDD